MKKIKFKDKTSRKTDSYSHLGDEISRTVMEEVNRRLKEQIPSYQCKDETPYKELKGCLIYKLSVPSFDESEISVSTERGYLKVVAEKLTANDKIRNSYSFSIPKGFELRKKDPIKTNYDGKVLEVRLMKGKD